MFQTPYLLGVRFWLAKLQSIRRSEQESNLRLPAYWLVGRVIHYTIKATVLDTWQPIDANR